MGTLKNHPNFGGISLVNHPAIGGTPMTMETPIFTGKIYGFPLKIFPTFHQSTETHETRDEPRGCLGTFPGPIGWGLPSV